MHDNDLYTLLTMAAPYRPAQRLSWIERIVRNLQRACVAVGLALLVPLLVATGCRVLGGPLRGWIAAATLLLLLLDVLAWVLMLVLDGVEVAIQSILRSVVDHHRVEAHAHDRALATAVAAFPEKDVVRVDLALEAEASAIKQGLGWISEKEVAALALVIATINDAVRHVLARAVARLATVLGLPQNAVIGFAGTLLVLLFVRTTRAKRALRRLAYARGILRLSALERVDVAAGPAAIDPNTTERKGDGAQALPERTALTSLPAHAGGVAALPEDGFAVQIAKATGGIVGKLVPEAIGSAFSILSKGADAMLDIVNQQNQRRYEEFCRAALDGTVFSENAEDLSAEDLLTMLRACLADLENEKAPLYGRLASAIASGRVPRPYRYPLMASLSVLTYGQVERLRHALIAAKYPLIPHAGPGRRSQAEFLCGDGLVDLYDLEKLTGLSMVKDQQISKLAHHLIVACYKPDALTPGAIGAQAWRSENGVLVMGSDLYDRVVIDFYNDLALLARIQGIKLAPLASPPVEGRNRMLGGAHGCFVVIAGSSCALLLERAQPIQTALDCGALVVVACTGAADPAVIAAFPAALIEARGEPASTAAAVVARLVDLVERSAGRA